MKFSKIAVSSLTLAVTSAFTVQAADDRYIIQVDHNNNKGIVQALAKQYGATIELDANGFLAATFKGKSLSQVKGLLNNPHITLVEADERRQLMVEFVDLGGDPTSTNQVKPYAVEQSQADHPTLENDLLSDNIKVCIIDSGLDHTNPDFDRLVITGDDDSGTGNWFDNGGPHGTHVAGTVGAADNGFGVVGMAPGVSMHIIKVFNADGWGYSSDLAQAANLCGAAGANIISMSLGGGRANRTEENAFKDFTAAGGLVIAAAGNDGNTTKSYPAGYDSVMMIGANDADNKIASFSQYPSCGKGGKANENTCVEVTAGGVATLSTYPEGMARTTTAYIDGTELNTSAMENLGSTEGLLDTFDMGFGQVINTGAEGKVCIIKRGEITFHDKVKNCEASGGKAAIIFNNEPGMVYGTLGEGADNTTTIPAVGAAEEDGDTLIAASSASVSIEASDYGYMSGTSMATPAVAGVAALVWSHFRNNVEAASNCTGTEIRAALKATALDATTNTSGNRIDDKFGYGIVKAHAAYQHLISNQCSTDTGGEDPVDPVDPKPCRGGPKQCG